MTTIQCPMCRSEESFTLDAPAAEAAAADAFDFDAPTPDESAKWEAKPVEGSHLFRCEAGHTFDPQVMIAAATLSEKVAMAPAFDALPTSPAPSMPSPGVPGWVPEVGQVAWIRSGSNVRPAFAGKRVLVVASVGLSDERFACRLDSGEELTCHKTTLVGTESEAR